MPPAHLISELRALTALAGPPGAEDAVADAVAAELEGLATTRDSIGNLILAAPERPRVLVTAHLDQVAYMVCRVEDGRAQCLRVGSPRLETGDRTAVRVLCADGEPLDGELESLGEDGGVLHAPALERVRTGDLVVYAPGLEELGDGRVRGPSLDDRIGCLLSIHAARALADDALPVAFAWTVREESEQAGVLRVARDLDPELLVAVDITYATTPDEARESPIVVGQGPAVTLLDGGMVGHPPLVAAVARAAESIDVPLQPEVVSLGTSEAGRVQRTAGIPSVALLVPIDNPHSPDETADMRDVEQAIDLLVATVRALCTAPIGARA